ncbi:MAG: CBS domain-containing protein [Bacillota bacterium]
MELITSHVGTDFDGLAAMVAANKLYPDATKIFAGKLSPNVKDFMSLYKDRILIKRVRDVQCEINQDLIERLIVVDTRISNRLGDLSQLASESDVELVIYDHHPELDDELVGDQQTIEPVGSTTALLCRELQEQNLEITPFEATLFMLGIYEDTGCLTFSSTTSLDAQAASFLLDQGANLSVVREFIERPLSAKQQQLFTQLLNSLEVHNLAGLTVNVYQATLDQYVGEVAYLTHKLDDLNYSDVLFTIVRLDHKVLIVARSNVDTVDVAEIIKEYGGGGHSKAASAMINDSELSLTDLESELVTAVEDKMEPVVLAEDIMSTPVRTINPDKSMEQAEELMLRYGHSGLVVVDEDNHLSGVISRRDVDKVKQHDLMHAPVKGYMSRNVVTINQETTFKNIQQQMVEHDIGRLPVLDDEGELRGIVTRSDVLRVIYGKADYIMGQQNRYGRSIVKVKRQTFNEQSLLQRLDEPEYQLLVAAGKIADQLDAKLYIVGGLVRDLILGIKNLDLDLVIEGDGIKFASQLAKELSGEVKEVHQDFGTAEVEVDDSLKIDIASCRVEFYEQPGALPEVENSSLKEDLFRRDFTINALAIQLNQEHFGRLIDYFGGKEDLEEGLIRTLHNFSFIDDPTRIFRAIRFANRYDFTIERLTKDLIKYAIEQDVVAGLSCGRLSNELELILAEERAPQMLESLKEFGLLEYFCADLTWTDQQHQLALELSQLIEWFTNLDSDLEVDRWQLRLMLLAANLSSKQVDELADYLNLNAKVVKRVKFVVEEATEKLESLTQRELARHEIYYQLKSLEEEELLYLVLIAEDEVVQERITTFLLELDRIELEVTGKDIIELGYQPGPYFKDALEEVKKKKLNGQLEGYQQELDYLRKYLTSLEEESQI